MTSSKYAAAHASPAGPGDARPTAADIVKDEGMTGKLGGKVFVITGCSAGIGIETARALITTGASKTLRMWVMVITVCVYQDFGSIASGADLYLTARDMQKGQKVIQDLLASSSNTHGKVELLHLELDSLQSVRDCAECFLKKSKTLNVLINNAGMLAKSSASQITMQHHPVSSIPVHFHTFTTNTGVMATPEGQTKDGFETQFGVNHLGHFLLFKLLEKTLLASATPAFCSRVVSLSSSGHKSSPILFDDYDLKKAGYTPFKAYGQSKTANIYLANEVIFSLPCCIASA